MLMNLLSIGARRTLRKRLIFDDATFRIVRILPVPLLGILCLANLAAGSLVLNTASWGAAGSLYVDSGVQPTINRSDFQQGVGPVNVDGEVDEKLEKHNNNGTLFASARVYSSFRAGAATGSLHVSVHGFLDASNNPSTALTPLNTGFGSANLDGAGATARWQDTAIVSVPGPPGKLVYAYGLLLLDGEMSSEATGDPADNRDTSALIQLLVSGVGVPDGPYGGHAFASYYDNLTHAPKGEFPPPPRIFTVLAMKNGEPYTIDYSMSISVRGSAVSWARTDGNANISFDGDFMDTLKWGGITSVTDAQGNPIAGWTITSASGLDYSHAVPEPATLVLMILAAAGWCLLRNRAA